MKNKNNGDCSQPNHPKIHNYQKFSCKSFGMGNHIGQNTKTYKVTDQKSIAIFSTKRQVVHNGPRLCVC